ncbi:hypothetical protein [Bacillus marasmi]|uniref:hypothetical protein n=1 Tax=Bacillus marasmi TaxID=1926279 RepID=UPI0011C782EB|nr:hypothetical protein [Bacillus marasmi]
MITEQLINQFSKNEILEDLSQFGTKDEFHRHIAMWIDEYEADFTRCELLSLQWIIVLAEKEDHLGVCNETTTNILETVCNASFGCCFSGHAFPSAIRKALGMELISIYRNGIDENGLQSFIYVFNRFEA